MAEPLRIRKYESPDEEIAALRKEQKFIGEYRVGPEANQRLTEIREKLAKLLEKRGEK